MAASDFGNEIEIFFEIYFFLQIFLFFIFASQREPLIAYKYSGSSSRSWHFNVSIATLRSMLRVVLVATRPFGKSMNNDPILQVIHHLFFL